MSEKDIDQLLSVYSVERQDDASSLVLSFSMVTAGFTYMIAATVFVHSRCTDGSACNGPGWFQLVIPIVPIAVLGFLVLTAAATRMRSVHLRQIEEILLTLENVNQSTGSRFKAPRFHTDAGMIWRPDNFWSDIGHMIFTAVNGIVYGIIFLAVISFTFSTLFFGPVTNTDIIIACVYGLALLVIISGFVVSHRGEVPLNMNSDLYQRAQALYGQATELVLAGRLQEALPVCRESVEAHRILADGRDEYLLDFAIALQSLSAVLQWTDRLPETVTSLTEELEIRRRLAAGNDPEHRRELARVLSILGTALASAGNATEATSSAADSVEICRELYSLNPAAYRESLGHSLTDLLRIYVGCELFEYAETVAAEAEETWRGSDEHLIYLAEVLHMYAFALSQIGSNEAALGRLGESIEIYERLGEESRPQFAGGLAAYGRLLGLTGRTREATRFLIKALALADRFGHEHTIEAAVGLLQDAYRVDRQAMTEEWKKATGTKVPRWLRS